MKEYEKVQIVQNSLMAIVCDCCGRRISTDLDDVFELQEVVSVDITGGYSSVFGDGIRLHTDLCQECVKKILGPYLKEVPPETHEIL